MNNAILLTGGTGFVGTEVALRLLTEMDAPLYVLVRAENAARAAHRLRAAWQSFAPLQAQVGARVIPVPGDFTKPDLGLAPEQARLLLAEVGTILHVGGEVDFQSSWSKLAETNRAGTDHMLKFARRIHRAGGLRRFVYLSTAYVAGQRRGRIAEDTLVWTRYSSLYERSKAEAERLVRASGLPFAVCRPGMIVGNSRTGYIRNFNTVYYVLRLLLTGKVSVLPVSAEQRIGVIPVDYVADGVVRAALAPDFAGKTCHLTCPEDMAPTAGELLDAVRRWAAEELGFAVPPVRFVPLPLLGQAGLVYNTKGEGRKKNGLTNLLTILPYFYGEQQFDRKNAEALLGAYRLNWRDYIGAELDFACRKGFLRQTGQTVYEQAMVRRAGRSYPVNYYNVTAQGVEKVSGPEANRRIEVIRDALWACGIRKGDKIALTGINSVDYMALDSALGLLGAVTVPLYYTTPADEVELLLDRSGAGWFFVGDKRMMNQLKGRTLPAQVVAFSTALEAEVENSDLLRWEDFLARAGEKAPAQDVDPGDLATIRYTSGTTGEPKGVMFDYGQLAWMGEAMSGLLPWKERNTGMRYLSFLPQSHVVEGILAANAPYYMRCPVDFYYLNDFPSLAEKLPQVRPTVFFSVPRFYEKVWDQLTANRVGQLWLTMPEGPNKKRLGAVLKKIILKKAGLDACSQLIVGSAPMSEALLQSFRALGIEIYNAYGQTEAPLITINRKGDNIIPTIGTPLPETSVLEAPDGELIVRGPQVARGYYGLDTDTIRDGVLKTGDLGSIGADGHIRLHGRKKEMIITAYGKNINCPKIEERLKNIPGVSEAVLIGENRPYCTALLWLEGECPDLAGAVAAMNEGLSHPEQIKRYAVIAQPLSVQGGELTPNLKVKRAVVAQHFAAEIEGLYA